MKESKEHEENKDMEEFLSALLKLIKAKTESLEIETELNKEFMKDNGIGSKIEVDSKQDWPDNFSNDWG